MCTLCLPLFSNNKQFTWAVYGDSVYGYVSHLGATLHILHQQNKCFVLRKGNYVRYRQWPPLICCRVCLQPLMFHEELIAAHFRLKSLGSLLKCQLLPFSRPNYSSSVIHLFSFSSPLLSFSKSSYFPFSEPFHFPSRFPTLIDDVEEFGKSSGSQIPQREKLPWESLGESSKATHVERCTTWTPAVT